MTPPAPDDGGPVYPVAENHKVAADLPWTCGMSLRDYFAAKYISGVVVRRPGSLWQWVRWCFGLDYDVGKYNEKNLSENAYRVADAMLAARKAVKP